MIGNLNRPSNIAIIGGGSWATALIKIFCENDVAIKWWLRNADSIQYIKQYQHNPHYLSDVQLDLKKVKPEPDIRKAVQNADYVVLAIPSAFLQDTLKDLTWEDFRGRVVVSGIKGIVPQEGIRVSQYLEKEFKVPDTEICVIGGPSHSEEIALEKDSFFTVACKDFTNAVEFSHHLTCRYVRSHVITDLAGMEYAAIMKNIIAISVGICNGLNYGDNFQAVLLSNAMQEMQRFLQEVAPADRDLLSSAYMGDLLVTAYSKFSRNRMFGTMIGRGYSVKAVQLEMNMIAEGYYAIKSIFELNRKLNVDMPVLGAVYNILYNDGAPATEIQILKSLLK